MDSGNDTIAWLSFVVSVIALIISGFAAAYSYRLSSRQITRHDQEEEDRKKADLTITLMGADGSDRSARTVVISNHGQAAARNVRAEIPRGQGLLIDARDDELFPIQSILPEGRVCIPARIHAAQTPVLKIVVLWADDESHAKTSTQKLFLS